jgi:hypothetical protein
MARSAKWIDATIADGEKHGELSGAGKERLADDHLGQHHGEREQIRTVIEMLSRYLLGGKVSVFALQNLASGRPRLFGNRARNTEVAEFDRAGFRQIDVGGSDVPMHDPEGIADSVGQSVHAAERLGELAGHEDGEPGRDGALIGLGAAH